MHKPASKGITQHAPPFSTHGFKISGFRSSPELFLFGAACFKVWGWREG